MVRLTPEPIDVSRLLAEVHRPGCGALVTFLGTVRDFSQGKETVALDYEAHTGLAEKMLRRIEEEVRGRWPVGGLAVVHRTGHLAVGEVSVAVAVSCPHRAEAFEACRHVIERLKEVVPIWKKENWADGTGEWVHPARGERGKDEG